MVMTGNKGNWIKYKYTNVGYYHNISPKKWWKKHDRKIIRTRLKREVNNEN